MLLTAKDTKSAIQEVNQAFQGEQDYDYIPCSSAGVKGSRRIKVTKVARKNKRITSEKRYPQQLDPIYEVGDSHALMKFDDTKEKARLRQILKDKVKKIVTSTTASNTFVTGGGLPNKPSQKS
jgi:hypothetical protein